MTILTYKPLPANTQLGYLQRVEIKEDRELEAFLSLGFCGDNYLTRHPDSNWITHTKNDKRQGKLFGEYLYNAWKEPDVLIGCRFTPKHCHYVVIDLDSKGRYHSLEGLGEVKAALEQIGLVRSILIRSSNSNGWHLWFPLGIKGKAGEVYGTDRTAWAVRCALEDAGLEIAPGHLEIFPNTRSSRGALYNGHRLPLQPESGSYVLDDEALPLHNDLTVFANLWRMCAEGQDHESFRAATKENGWERVPKKQHEAGASHDDLRLLEEGWTGYGQSNEIMLAAARYITAENPTLSCESKADALLEMVVALPGFRQFCRHKLDLQKWSLRITRAWGGRRAADAICPVDYSIYRCDKPRRSKASSRQTSATKAFNRMKTEDVQARIMQAVEKLPYQEGQSLTKYRQKIKEMSGAGVPALSKHKKLWHPNHLSSA